MSSDERIHHAETRFGFEYGDATVERSWSHKGYVSVMIRSMTTGQYVEVTVSPKGRSVRVERGSMKMSPPSKPPIPSECAGCGFAHANDYKDCVWLKNPY